MKIRQFLLPAAQKIGVFIPAGNSAFKFFLPDVQTIGF
jgi:hypothetical protein